MPSTPETSQGRGAIRRIAPLLLVSCCLLLLSYHVGATDWSGGPLLLAAVSGFLAMSFVLGAMYEVGKLEMTTLVTEAWESMRELTEQMNNAAEAPIMIRLTGGGPMDGMQMPHPMGSLRDPNLHGRLIIKDGDEGFVGAYEQSEDDPSMLVWAPGEDDDDAV